MQVKKPYYAIILAAVGALATISHAAIPYKINYQGRLTRNGSAVNNETHQMSFKLYDTISGGTLIWTSVDQTVAVNNGVFSVVLDAGSPAALSTATFTASRYLELTIDGSTTLTPRETMSASPYAFVAQSLMSGVAVSVSQITIADGTQGSGKVLTSDTHGLASWQTPASGGDVYKASTQTFSGQNTFLNMLTISTRVVITDGTQGASKVLTSDTHGLASWQTPASGGDVYKASTQTFSGQNTFLNMVTISTRVAITDGTQGASKVLTSDANGLASWQTPASGGDVYKASTQTFSGQNTFLNMVTISTRVAITDGTQGASKVLTSDANGLASWQTPASGGDVYKASTQTFSGQNTFLNMLTISTRVAITDGTQGASKVLTSDANGLASWQTPASGGDVYKASTQTFSGQNTFLNMVTISTRVAITDGTQGASKVLTSDANGLASWQTPASGGDVYKASTQTFSGQNTFLNMLTISTRVAITDGTQGASKVLTSDANGLASWQTPASGGDVYKASTQSFTGGNTFASWSVFAGSATFTSSVTIPSGVFSVGAALAISSGAVQLSRNLTQSDDAGVTLAMADSGKTITVNSASDQIIHLPAVDATMIGAWFTIVKLNTGKVTVAAGAGSSIADSGVGGTIYDSSSAETYASITLRLASAAQWVIMGGDGSWTTTN